MASLFKFFCYKTEERNEDASEVIFPLTPEINMIFDMSNADLAVSNGKKAVSKQGVAVSKEQMLLAFQFIF